MGYIEKGVLTIKGNIACVLSSTHGFLLTELLLSGFFNNLTASEIASLITIFLNEESN